MQSNDPQAEAQKHRMQMENILLDSDLKKNERLKAQLEIDIRTLQHKRAQIDSEYAAKESLLKRTDGQLIIIRNEMLKLKHRMLNI